MKHFKHIRQATRSMKSKKQREIVKELSAFYILAILYSSRTKLEKMKKHIKFMQN